MSSHEHRYQYRIASLLYWLQDKRAQSYRRLKGLRTGKWPTFPRLDRKEVDYWLARAALHKGTPGKLDVQKACRHPRPADWITLGDPEKTVIARWLAGHSLQPAY